MYRCHICDSEIDFFSEGKVLRKYTISYYKCPKCGFVQTETPYWLDEAYSEAIVDADIGLAGRNYMLAHTVEAILKICFNNKTINHLDYGGGYGLFTRLMRDRGFDFEWYDKYCVNIFAKYFTKKKEHYDVVTAFELLEHLSNPYDDLDKIMGLGDIVICSTALLPSTCPKPHEWWYYVLDGGQHISFYTESAMRHIARHYNRYYCCVGDLHIFSRVKISRLKMRLAIKYPSLINKLVNRNSLISEDWHLITGGLLE